MCRSLGGPGTATESSESALTRKCKFVYVPLNNYNTTTLLPPPLKTIICINHKIQQQMVKLLCLIKNDSTPFPVDRVVSEPTRDLTSRNASSPRRSGAQQYPAPRVKTLAGGHTKQPSCSY